MEVSSLLLYKADKILLVRDRYEDFWTLPGGKVESAESKREALEREMKEELPLVSYAGLSFYGEFFGITPHSRRCLVVSVFTAQYIGGKTTPHNEITASKWIGMRAEGLRMTQSTQNIINSFYSKKNRKQAGP